MEGEILYRVENRVAHLTLGRPHRHDALSITMRRRWGEVLMANSGAATEFG